MDNVLETWVQKRDSKAKVRVDDTVGAVVENGNDNDISREFVRDRAILAHWIIEDGLRGILMALLNSESKVDWIPNHLSRQTSVRVGAKDELGLKLDIILALIRTLFHKIEDLSDGVVEALRVPGSCLVL